MIEFFSPSDLSCRTTIAFGYKTVEVAELMLTVLGYETGSGCVRCAFGINYKINEAEVAANLMNRCDRAIRAIKVDPWEFGCMHACDRIAERLIADIKAIRRVAEHCNRRSESVKYIGYTSRPNPWLTSNRKTRP